MAERHDMTETVLDVKNLRTYFYLDEGVLKAVDSVDFRIARQKTLGIIGESGCGKSVTAQSILRIVPQPGNTVAGSAYFSGTDLQPLDLLTLNPTGDAIRNIRGKNISMIFQEPMTSLSPVHKVGDQITEAVLLHKTRNKKEARELTLDILDKVGVPSPSQRIDYYPHQLSGGLRQRVMIAMALSCHPDLLIADEPTTALDVTVQAQILDLMQHLQEQLGMSIMYITHNLGVIAEIADTVAVMYLGRVVEEGTAEDIFYHPLHPYTAKLLKSIPKVGRKARIKLDVIEGNVPIPLNPPRECGFYSRCDRAIEGTCDTDVPALIPKENGHMVRCFLHSKEREVNDEREQ